MNASSLSSSARRSLRSRGLAVLTVLMAALLFGGRVVSHAQSGASLPDLFQPAPPRAPAALSTPPAGSPRPPPEPRPGSCPRA